MINYQSNIECRIADVFSVGPTGALPQEDLSKRPWECKLQHWRKAIRTWHAENGGADADDISESE